MASSSDINGKTVVFVRTSSNSRDKPYEHLHGLGLNIIFVHPHIVNWAVPYAKHWILQDTADVDGVVTATKAFLAEHPEVRVDGVLSFDEYGVFPAAVLGQALSVTPCPCPPEVVRLTNIKTKFREWSKGVGLRSPRAWSVPTEDDVEAFLRSNDVTFPAIVKPCPGAGSMLVVRCNNAEEMARGLRAGFDGIKTNSDVRNWCAVGTTMHLLVEEFIGGQEVDIDCIVQNGEIKYAAISDNFPTEAPHFREEGGVMPSMLPADAQEDLMGLVRTYVKAHGTAINSLLHFEAKYDFDRKASYVIEVNLRMGAAETYCMNKQSTGVDLGEEYVRLACGLPVSIPPFVPRPMASVNFLPQVAGTLTSQELSSEVVSSPQYVAHRFYFSPGSPVNVPPQCHYALGWMVATGETCAEAVKHKEELAAKFEFIIKQNE
eukprot:PhM_4_TR469/c0_g1_i3/m.59926